MNTVKVPVSALKVGNKISEDVLDKNKKVIVAKDTIIDQSIIDFLMLHSIDTVYIYMEDTKNEIKSKVDEIFSKVNNDNFMKKFYTIVLEFRCKNNI